MPDTPSQKLREAAKLMRERAKPCDQGPWAVDHDAPGAGSLISGADWSIARGHSDEAEYIASMHPGVGMAAAALLEAVVPVILDAPYEELTGAARATVDFARAYLGSES
jgi:hypothetical protein